MLEWMIKICYSFIIGRKDIGTFILNIRQVGQ
jgi:hypothetical protein